MGQRNHTNKGRKYIYVKLALLWLSYFFFLLLCFSYKKKSSFILKSTTAFLIYKTDWKWKINKKINEAIWKVGLIIKSFDSKPVLHSAFHRLLYQFPIHNVHCLLKDYNIFCILKNYNIILKINYLISHVLLIINILLLA